MYSARGTKYDKADKTHVPNMVISLSHSGSS